VAAISNQLALRLARTPGRCARLREAALLHDVGKIGVPDSILTKPAALTEEEYKRVKTHAALGAQIVEGVLDAEQVSWVRGHHERPDGRGYPDALTAATIPDGARLLAIADAYDTVTSGRPYMPAISPAQATREMRRHAGTQFDTDLLDRLDHGALAGTTAADTSQTTPMRVITAHDATDPATNETRGLIRRHGRSAHSGTRPRPIAAGSHDSRL
jgi:HD-GYP domain-containing protein (c-di-GMP phosphodiesterase class II)